MTKILESSGQQQINVRLFHRKRGELGNGRLSFGGNLPTQVILDISTLGNLVSGEQIELVQAATESGKTFTLCSCRVHGFGLYPEYLIESDIEYAEFDQIVVRYREASEWFLHWEKKQGQVGGQLTWKQKSEPLSVTVSTDEDQFKLSSEYIGFATQAGEDLIIHEHIEFMFSSTGRKFNLMDVRNKVHELSCLLSILIAYPVTAMSVKIGLKSKGFSRFHFPVYTHPERDMSDSGFWLKWFVQKPRIEYRWQTIFTHYYNSNYREICWVRLAGMQRYEGFWEYKALGYISLLDKYVTLRSDKKKRPKVVPVAEKMTKFRHEVDKRLPLLNALDAKVIKEIADDVFGTKRLTFGEKYTAVIAETDQDIVKIISISKSDFQFIKKIRDAIAHGDDPGLQEDEHSKAGDVVGKITLLLTYWAFLDFGLTKDDFIACLRKTHSSLRFSCVLDSVHLDRISGSASFFSVTVKKFDELSKIGVCYCPCFVRESNGELSFSEHYTQMYKDWMKSPSRSPGKQQAKEIFGVENDAAQYFGKSYIESGENRLEVSSLWIIDTSQ